MIIFPFYDRLHQLGRTYVNLMDHPESHQLYCPPQYNRRMRRVAPAVLLSKEPEMRRTVAAGVVSG